MEGALRADLRSLRFMAAVAAVALGVLPQRADAHGLLRTSSPAADSVLRASPAEIRLTFTEAPEPRFTRIRLIGAHGQLALGALRILAGNVAVARVPTTLDPGGYLVEWSTAGNDGHPVSGRFSFTVARESGQPQATVGSDGSPPVT